MNDNEYLAEAIEIARKFSVRGNNGPFGAVIVLDGNIIGKGWNQVVELNDPTAHAEVMAIREACKNSGTYNLTNAILYSSCEPCPMCMSAIYWARIKKVFFAASRLDASNIGFDDSFIYDELSKAIHKREIPLVQELQHKAIEVFDEWSNNPKKIMY